MKKTDLTSAQNRELDQRLIYMKNLLKTATEADIRKIFEGYGKIISVRIKEPSGKSNNNNNNNNEGGNNNTETFYCSIKFSTKEEANRVIKEKDQIYNKIKNDKALQALFYKNAFISVFLPKKNLMEYKASTGRGPNNR